MTTATLTAQAEAERLRVERTRLEAKLLVARHETAAKNDELCAMQEELKAAQLQAAALGAMAEDARAERDSVRARCTALEAEAEAAVVARREVRAELMMAEASARADTSATARAADEAEATRDALAGKIVRLVAEKVGRAAMLYPS